MKLHAGTRVLDAGSTEVSVESLSLPSVPVNVTVSLRQPAEDSGIVGAYVVGVPTATGFSVAFSAPIPGPGYHLDWVAMVDEEVPMPGDTLAVDYLGLVQHVARFLGYDPDNLSEREKSEVDAHIQSGVRNFYHPPKMEGVDENFEWSFLRMECSIETTPGVAVYRMPDGFGRVAGTIGFGGEDMHIPPVGIVPLSTVEGLLRSGKAGAPRVAAFVPRQSFGEHGQYVEMRVFPVPDRVYVLRFRGDSDTGRISEERPFPLGGHMFSELVIESCLAVAEQRSNDESGLHTQLFNELLVSMIAKDRKSSAAVFGQMGDMPDIPPPHGKPFVMGGMKITYRGQTW